MILVTGGGGFLGGHIVDQLLAEGQSVRVFGRNRYPRLERPGVEFAIGDLQDPGVVREACSGCDAVFHVAAIPGVWGTWEKYHGPNTLGTDHVIAGCIAESVPRLIYTSSPSVIYDGEEHHRADESLPYPHPDSYLCAYPKSKALAEQAVRSANGTRLKDGSGVLSTVALRPHLIWGPRDNHLIPRLLDRARSGRLRVVGDRSNLISMSYVENAAAAHLQAAATLTPDSAAAGQAYFINEPEPVRLWDWVDEILALVGQPPVKKHISAKAAWRVGAACEMVWKILRKQSEPPMTRFVASQLSSSHHYSITNAQRDFGFTPLVTVEEGMRRLGESLQTND